MIWLWLALAHAASTAGGLQLNPALHLQVTEVRPAASAKSGFEWQAKGEEWEIFVKGTPIPSESIAAQMAASELGNLKNLYATRGSPYPGQITELVKCQDQFAPLETSLEVPGGKVSGIMGGATLRKLFGACNQDQIAYWAEYFGFYDRSGSRMIDVRIFERVEHPTSTKSARAQMQSFNNRLWSTAAK